MSKNEPTVYKMTPEQAAKKKAKRAIPYKGRQKGIPVEPGMNFADLPIEVRNQYFIQHENYWKSQYNRSRGTLGLQNQTFDRNG